MKSNELLEIIGEAQDDYILDAKTAKKKHTPVWVKWAAMAACLAIILAVGAPVFLPQYQIQLSDKSVGVTARYTNIPINFGSADSLVYLTEEELFTEFDTAIFKGIITDISNIVLDFNGRKNHRAIAEIQIEQVYRGECKVGEIVNVLLPCPVATQFWVSDTEIVSKMTVGMTGIFMPMIYDENSMRQENGATLMLQDIADYGFADGSRYAFLDTESGLVFSRTAYESISEAKTLAEIEKYVIMMIEKAA